MTVEAYVKYDAFKSWSRIFDFGDTSSARDSVGLFNNDMNGKCDMAGEVLFVLMVLSLPASANLLIC